MDIVNAKTDQSLKVAINQHQGKLSKTINKLRHNLLELLAYIEADIDFPDDDIERLTNEEIKRKNIIVTGKGKYNFSNGKER